MYLPDKIHQYQYPAWFEKSHLDFISGQHTDKEMKKLAGATESTNKIPPACKSCLHNLIQSTL